MAEWSDETTPMGLYRLALGMMLSVGVGSSMASAHPTSVVHQAVQITTTTITASPPASAEDDYGPEDFASDVSGGGIGALLALAGNAAIQRGKLKREAERWKSDERLEQLMAMRQELARLFRAVNRFGVAYNDILNVAQLDIADEEISNDLRKHAYEDYVQSRSDLVEIGSSLEWYASSVAQDGSETSKDVLNQSVKLRKEIGRDMKAVEASADRIDTGAVFGDVLRRTTQLNGVLSDDIANLVSQRR